MKFDEIRWNVEKIVTFHEIYKIIKIFDKTYKIIWNHMKSMKLPEIVYSV